jgi:hemolysin activation/secretion protein
MLLGLPTFGAAQGLPPVPAPAPEEGGLAQPRLRVRAIEVTGSTVFTSAALEEVTAPYLQRELTVEDLEELRLALTRYYVNHGYITSGAIIPNQTLEDGVLRLHILEGALQRIEVEGNRWFRAGYLRRRLALAATTPLNIHTLQERLQLLQQDERIERLDAQLQPGIQRGESLLHVRVTEPLPFSVALAFDNYQSPSVGAERGLVTVAHRNLTGNGDIASVTYGRSDGLDLLLDASYTLPLTVSDTTISLRYRKNASIVVEEPIASAVIESESEVYGITLRHPLYRTLSQELTVALVGEHERNKTSLGSEPFSPTSSCFECVVTVFRMSLEWLARTPNRVLALRARFSYGIDALGATILDSGSLPDGAFFAWLGQGQWAQRLTDWGLQTVLRVDLQLANDALLPLEQIAVGGRFSVRGYRENQLVRDNGVIAALEFRLPLVQNKPWAEFIQLAPFVDFGSAWNTHGETPEPRHLTSIGVGLLWAMSIPVPVRLRPQLEVYWGYPLRNVTTSGGNVQDLGLHFQVLLTAF